VTSVPPRRTPSAYTWASSSLTPTRVSAPTIPPVTPPIAAPPRIGKSHPKPTIGPTPGYGEQGQQTRCGSGRCASAV
jgi:hypothetical protein